ncbi:MAG: hypothetical protein ACXVJW_14375 [Acidimicrobiia bacterium]
MSIDEARRLLLHDAARNAWGAEAALVLMEMLPPTGWADVATRQQLDQLEARFNSRLDHELAAVRFELRAEMADGYRRIIQWNVATVIAAITAMTAILKLS